MDRTAEASKFGTDEWKRKKRADMHSFTHTQTKNKVQDFINEREGEGEREFEADRAALKRNGALTHFTVERPQATPVTPQFPKVCVCVCERERERNPLLFSISLSCVPCSLLHCSVTSNLLIGGVSCTLRT